MPKSQTISDLLKNPLKIEQWPIDRLIEYARNPRKNDTVVDKMVAAIKEFGFRIPIVAKSDGSVVDGHLRLKAAQKLGMKEVPVALADELTDAQVKAFRLLANRSVEWAEWDNDLLKLELDELKEMDFDLELTGFELDEIKKITGLDADTGGLTDPDDVPEVQENEPPVSKTGDIWILGNHRLMCGDSTEVGSVALLMAGQKANMVFTDPPYGMNLDTDYSAMKTNLNFAKDKGAFGGKKYVQGKVDDFQPDMIQAIFALDANEVFLWGADYYAEMLPDKNGGGMASLG